MSRTRLKEVCFHNCSGIRHLRTTCKERKSSTECKSKEIQPRMCIGQEAAFLSGFQKADEGGWQMPSSEPHPLSVQWLQDCHAHQRAIIENVSCLAPPDSPGNRFSTRCCICPVCVYRQLTRRGGGVAPHLSRFGGHRAYCFLLSSLSPCIFLPVFLLPSLSSFFPLCFLFCHSSFLSFFFFPTHPFFPFSPLSLSKHFSTSTGGGGAHTCTRHRKHKH